MTKVTDSLPIAEQRRASRIPAFNTLEEEAAFWDTHDSAEYEDEFDDAPDVIFVPAQPKRAITVRLEKGVVDLLSRQAHEQGMSASALIRTWILERLRQPQKHPA